MCCHCASLTATAMIVKLHVEGAVWKTRDAPFSIDEIGNEALVEVRNGERGADCR